MMETKRREITKEEVETHNTDKDCWIVVHDLVLKLPEEFMMEHPGGSEVISCLAGKDVTQDYEDIAHSDSAREWTNKYIIGYIEGATSTEEKDPKTKLIPTSKEMGGGDTMGILPLIFALIVAVAAYFIMNRSS